MTGGSAVIKSIYDKEMNDPKFRSAYKAESFKLNIGETIAKLRHKNTMTQLDLAKKAKTSRSAIARYESGDYENYNIVTLQKIAQALGAELKVSFKS
jgi:ribosome-binding protein aMBF1 (putative translation factor)